MTRYFIATDSYISKIIDVDSLDTAKLIAKAILKKTTKRDRKQSLWPCCNIYSVDELDRNPDSARLTEIIISVPPIKPKCVTKHTWEKIKDEDGRLEEGCYKCNMMRTSFVRQDKIATLNNKLECIEYSKMKPTHREFYD